MITEKFRAMGTDIFVSFADIRDEVAKKELSIIKNDIENFEQRFSRFRKNSEISLLNDFDGDRFEASREMIELIKVSKRAYQETEGIFNPCVLSILEKIGYEKNFEELSELSEEEGDHLDIKKIQQDFLKQKNFSDIKVIDKKFVCKPSRFKIDFGGIGKGYIIDKIASDIKRSYKNFWISAGGDMILSGKDFNGHFWKVGVQNPNDLEKDIKIIKVIGEKMSIATSGIAKRRGIKQGFKWHHVIDPRLGLPVENDILSVTVIAPSATWADVFAKTVLILGKIEGIDFIDRKGDAECLIVDKNLKIFLSKNMGQYLV